MNPGIILQKLRLAIAVAGLWLGAMFISIVPAHADLRICNQTGNPVSIALGYRAERGWQSEGWWVSTPDQCATVYQGDLTSRFYYLFVADDIGGGAWDGSVFMCTRDETFTIFGVEDCLARGYERTGFFEIDTQSRSDWTLQLTSNGEAVPEIGDDGDAEPLDNIELPGEPLGGAGSQSDGIPIIDDEPLGDESAQ